MVRSGFYANRADVIRDAVRRFVFESQIGIISNKGNAVLSVRKARQKLSKEKIDIDEINSL
jgi:Arc/MetJ-type ribon-helix-helix transcriptional regulator